MTGWLVAVNPSAGARPIQIDRIRRALDAAGVEASVEVATDRATMGRLVREGSADGRLALVGGDGTVNFAINSLMAEGLPIPLMGILPAGTGCDLLRTFGIPQDLEGAAHHLSGDATYSADLGVLEGEWGTRWFLNVAQAGVGAAAAQTALRLPRRLGAQRYIGAFGIRLPRFPGGEIELTTEKRRHRGNALAVIMANAQFFAGGWNIAPKAMLVDGELDLQVIDVAKSRAPSLVPRIMAGLHLTDPGVRRISAARFRLETQYVWPVEVDGDYIGNTPVEGRVLASAIQLKI